MEKERETRECGGRCLEDEDREKWAEGGRVGGCWEGWHDAGIKSPIKLHGRILIYRLMSYCETNHSQPLRWTSRKSGEIRGCCNKLEMQCVVVAGENTHCWVKNNVFWCLHGILTTVSIQSWYQSLTSKSCRTPHLFYLVKMRNKLRKTPVHLSFSLSLTNTHTNPKICI